MHNNAKEVIRTACEFMINHQDQAIHQAESRASEEDSARWPVVVDTIRMLSDSTFMPCVRPPKFYLGGSAA